MILVFIGKNICRIKVNVRIFATPTKGLVVQLVRMPPCHGGGRGFESRPVRKKSLTEM